MGCAYATESEAPFKLNLGRHTLEDSSDRSLDAGHYFSSLVPMFDNVHNCPEAKKQFYEFLSAQMGELYTQTLREVEGEVSVSSSQEEDLHVRISKKILLNILNLVIELQKSSNWKKEKLTVFLNLSRAQKKIIEFLKFKYPRNKKHFIPSDLNDIFEDVNDTYHTDFDLLVNSAIFFDSDEVRDHGRKFIVMKIKEFFNKIIRETNRFYDSYKSNMEKIFEKAEGTFKIGRKISDNVSGFVDVQAADLRFHSPQIFRVVIKWIQSLQDMFTKTEEQLKDCKYFKIVEQEEDENFNREYSFFSLFTGKGEVISLISTVMEASIKKYNQQVQEHETATANFNDTLTRMISKRNSIPEVDDNQIKTIKYASYMAKFVEFLAVEKLVAMITELVQVRQQLEKKTRKAVDLIRCEVNDLLRCQFMGKKSEIIKVFEEMKKLENNNVIKMIRIKNRLSTPLNDCLINYMFVGAKGSFLVCEIQLILQDGAQTVNRKEKLYEKFNHILYEVERSMFRPTAELSLLLAYNDAMMGYESKIALEKEELDSMRCPDNEILSCEYDLPVPYICSLCSSFNPTNSNNFPIHRCSNCNFYACPRCIFQFDPKLRNECYEKEIQLILKKNVPGIEEVDDKKMFFFSQKYIRVSEVARKNRNLWDCLEEYMREHEREYSFILQIKNGHNQLHAYSIRTGKILPTYYDFLPRSIRKAYKSKTFGPDDIVLFLNEDIKVEAAAQAIDSDETKARSFLPEVVINKRVKEVFQFEWENNKYSLDVGQEMRDGDYPQQLSTYHSSHSCKNSITSTNRYGDASEFEKALLQYKNFEGRLELDYLDLPELNIKTLSTVNPKCLRFVQLKSNKLKNVDAFLGAFDSLEEIDVSRNEIVSVSLKNAQPKMRVIDLSENFIDKISGFDEKNLPKLKSLNLAGNNIQNFPSLQLKDLIWLNCNNNKIRSMEALKDSSMPKLKKMSLNNNLITVIPVFQLPKLLELEADGNQIQNLDFIKNFESIEAISLINNKLSDVPKLHLQQLEIMKLSENSISDILNFADSELPRLGKLDLSNNKIKVLPHFSFEQLLDFNISHNQLSSLEALQKKDEAESNELLENLKWLDFSHNNLQSFPKISMENLEVLNCSHNFISDIQNLANSHLPILQELDVSHNKITTVPVFTAEQLEILNFSDNEIKSIEKFVKESKVPKLKILVFSNNKIAEFYSAEFPSLAEFKVDHNQIETIHQIELQHLQACVILDLSHNHMQVLPIMYLQSVEQLLLPYNNIHDLDQFKNSLLPELTHLDLSYNSLVEFPEMNMSKVTKLNLMRNKLKSMKGIAGSNLSSVQEINLSRNQLTSLAKVHMECLMNIDLSMNLLVEISGLEDWVTPEINQIILDKNRIQQLCPINSASLSYLSLATNQITSIDVFCSRSQLPKLVFLDLSTNHISNSLPPIKFESLKTLDLVQNNITSIDTFASTSELPKLDTLKISCNKLSLLPEFSHESFPRLKDLEAKKNNITSIDNFCYSELKKIKVLDLKKNELTGLPRLVFRNLTHLNCGFNKIGTLQEFDKSELPNLQQLNLSGNQIAAWPRQLYLENLRMLNLSDNQLKDIHRITFREYPQLVKLNLTNNQLSSLSELKLPKLLSLMLENNKINKNSAQLQFQLKENKSLINKKLQITIRQKSKSRQQKPLEEGQDKENIPQQTA